MWYLDSCCGQHMVGSERYISNAVSTPTVTYVTVANNARLHASAQGIVVLKARGSRTHITLNDVMIVQNLCFNLLSAAQLMDCGVNLSTEPKTCDILLHFTMPNKTRKQIGRAHSENGVYILDFSIPDCSGDSQELIDLIPLRFEHIHQSDWKHQDGRPWVPRHPHPCKLALHDSDPDDICRDCHIPTASTSAIAGRGLAAIAEAEREAPRGEGLSHLELETATHVVFGMEAHPLPRPASQHLRAEFRSKEMQDYLAQKGIEHHVSLPYAYQQQGVAERTNRTLMTKVRALMKQSKLPPTYWTYAMHHTVQVHNLLSTTAITGNSSPHVKWTGTKGNTSMLRVWGCMVHYRPLTSTIEKFASRARWGVHLGISHEHKAWLILDLMSKKVKNARDVIFYERLFLRQFHEDKQANANRVYANNEYSYASPEDEAATAILEQDPRGEFTRGNRDDDDDSLGGGAGTACGGGSGSSGGAAPPAPPEPESDDDDVQEVIPQHRHDNTVL
ncbi:unnamed protein product [Closterium sp. NIES-54]